MKKIAVLTTALSMLMTTGCSAAEAISSAAAPVVLKDMEGHWSKESVNRGVQKGYVDGYEDGTFRPENNVSRSEFIKMTMTALGISVPKAAEGEEWYIPYINAAVNAGIHRWDDFTTGGWNTPISRLEMARISVRASDSTFQRKEVNIDDKAVMLNATKAGLVQGLANGDLAPQNATTRGQSVTIIERILGVKEGEKLEVDMNALANAEIQATGTNFNTVFGKKLLIYFPFTVPVSSAYSVTFKDFTVVDMDNPNDPNYSYIRNNAYGSRAFSFDGKYVFLIRTHYSVAGTSNEGDYVSLPQTIHLVGFTRLSAKDKVDAFVLYKKQEIDSYLLYAYDKKEIEESINKGLINIFLDLPGTSITLYN
ncbi:hypothetical protein J2T17_004359 [Paenibacillus mucilaginosus]|uniref:S-layer homology domain-containing protein n=1 Tax=Paenibacillus mucilaginosus TaxID=61624 RepID=UPI003D2524FA